MKRFAVGTLAAAMLASALAVFGGGAGVVVAASCPTGNYTRLCNGSVSPTVGTTGTTFHFSVVYQDSMGRTPYFAQVIVTKSGGGPTTYDMGPTTGQPDPTNGVTMTFATKLAVGTYTYSFAGGRKAPAPKPVTRTFTPSPNTVTVTAPTPSPTKAPTPTPSPTKAPTPTPSPTLRPTLRPTPRPTPKPTPKPALSPSPSPSAVVVVVTAVPSASPTASPTPSPSATNGGAPSAVGAGPVTGTPGGQGGGSGAFAPLLLVALAAAGGFIFFAAWRRRRKPDDDDDEGVVAPLTPPPPPEPIQAAPPQPVRSRRLPKVSPALDLAAAAVAAGVPSDVEAIGAAVDERSLPRWRRPSLRAARAANERIPVATVPLAFGAATAGLESERRRVRYAVVPLVDAPDEIRSTEIGQLQQGDEVQLLTSQGRWMRVRTPVGTEGWVHKTTLGPLADGPAAGPQAAEATSAGVPDADVSYAVSDADTAGLFNQAVNRALAGKTPAAPNQPASPKKQRAPRRSRGTASAN